MDSSVSNSRVSSSKTFSLVKLHELDIKHLPSVGFQSHKSSTKFPCQYKRSVKLVFHITVLQSLHLHQALNPQLYNGGEKNKEEKKPTQLSLKIDFSLKKKNPVLQWTDIRLNFSPMTVSYN